jgi:hypothetical protein
MRIKDLKGGGHGLYDCTIPGLARRDWEKLRKTKKKKKKASNLSKIRI